MQQAAETHPIRKTGLRRDSWRVWLAALLIFSLQAACSGANPTAPPLADELVFYNWAEYMPQSVLDAFTKEYGVRVIYQSYDTPEQGVEKMRLGQSFDVVVLPPELIPGLLEDELLAEIDYRNVPNFKNVSPNFRDLAFDPGNRFSIPFHWGTTGLLVRTDLVREPVTSWKDLWRPEFAGKVGLWPIQRDLIPIALKSQGYPANSEDPQQLQQALDLLLALKPDAVLVGNENPSIIPTLQSGEVVIAYGWAYDALQAVQENLPIQYILPEEGSILWGDNLVIPANSPHKYTAEVFLNFILKPEISGQIINESYYAMPNQAADPFVLSEILNNPVIYPHDRDLQDAEITLPLSEEGQQLYEKIWDDFMKGRLTRESYE